MGEIADRKVEKKGNFLCFTFRWYLVQASLLCRATLPGRGNSCVRGEPLGGSAGGCFTSGGIDLGLHDFAVLSTGERIPNPRHVRKLERKLAHAQRALSRKRKGSRRYEKQARKVARLYERVANARADFLHKLSARLVAENQGIMAEDLSVKGLARTRLAKSVHDAGWGKFLRQLAYKAEWAGKVFHRIDRFFPSSKLHMACGTLNTLSLSDRVFECQGCGTLVDRDLNAALNIKHRGLVELSPVGQPGVDARGLDVRPATAGGPGGSENPTCFSRGSVKKTKWLGT